MIEVRNFSKEIKGKLILDHVNCSFEPGKVYGLMGVNREKPCSCELLPV